MQRVSSQFTIILRIFLPTVWFTLLLSIVVLLVWSVRGKAGLLANPFIWVGLLLILGCGFIVVYFFLWRLYRIDLDDKYLYVSNYFRTYKYPFSDIESITNTSSMPDRLFRITLKAKGSFGRHIYFLAAQLLWQDFLAENEEVRRLLK